MIGTRFAASQGNLGDIDKEVVNVIKHTSAAYESLQKEAENLNWSELPKVLEMLPGILGTYNEDLFRNLPTETKKHVVNAMGKALESSLDFTDQTIALLQEHQKESTRKGVDSMGDMQQYLRASRCVTSLAHVASQFEGFVSRSGSDIKPWPQEDFESKTCNTSIEYNEDVIPRFSYSGKVSKGFGLAVDEALPRSTNFLDASDLLAACQDRQIDLLEQLLKTPAINLDATDDKGSGVLHLALGTGKVNSDKSKMANIVNIVRLLCTHDANINAPDKSGLCPIHYCAQTINSEAAKCILDRGARINEPDLKGRTALYYVAVDGHPDVEFAKMLIRNGAKLGTAKLPKLPPRANESQKKVRLLVMKR
ncbi:ankyrin repeat-containing domain protein [Bisporella sp. PMI_857]|nr:ankyrin repeat-containing domain protein [Bisporella sp. PMI_857]